MADLVVSYLVRSRNGTDYGHRIWADGRAESYQTAKPVRMADGTFDYQAVHPDFYPVAQLSPAQVASARQAVAEAGLTELTDTVRSAGTGNSDPDTSEWQVKDGTTTRTIRVDPWPPDGAASGLQTLVGRIGAIILAAQSGSSQAPD